MAPSGVDAEEADPEGDFLQAWEGYGTIITEIEQALADIKGLGAKETEKHTGRAEGPKFRMANATAAKSSANGGRTNLVARAW